MFAKDLDIDKYSIVVAAGGDGSYHEVINGVLNRPDKRRLPVALLPNGSGNDLCKALGIMSLDHGLDYIVKRKVIKIDTNRVLMDHESEETLPEGDDRLNYCRHMMINAALSMPGKIANTAIPLKSCCGNKSYEIATLWEFCKCNFRSDHFDVFIDGNKVNPSQEYSVTSTLLMPTNGKFTGGGSIINPFSLMNDGLIDVTWISNRAVNKLTGVAGLIGDAKKRGGIQAYKGDMTFMRGKQLRI